MEIHLIRMIITLLLMLLLILNKYMWHHRILIQTDAVYAAAYNAAYDDACHAHTNLYYACFSAYACLFCQRSLTFFYSANTFASAVLLLLGYVNFSAYACSYCQRSLNCFYSVYTVASAVLILLGYANISAYACLYTVKEVSTASTVLILLLLLCLYCFCNLVPRRIQPPIDRLLGSR